MARKKTKEQIKHNMSQVRNSDSLDSISHCLTNGVQFI